MPSTSDHLDSDHTSVPTYPTHPTDPTPHPRNPKPSKKPSLSLKNLPDLLTVREVADVLRVSPLTIKRWGKKGHLPFVRINSRGDRRYKKEAVLWKLGISQETD